MQVLRVGDLALLGLPGEPFVEGQLAIKERSAAPYTLVAHLTTRQVGYVPTAEAYERNGHEANAEVTYWAKLAPVCLETVTESARALVTGLYA
jgi:neutral ceramidase